MKTIYPHPDLPEGHYVAGLGAAGAKFPEDEANELIERGLAVAAKPAAKAATKPRKAAAKKPAQAPEPPADKSEDPE